MIQIHGSPHSLTHFYVLQKFSYNNESKVDNGFYAFKYSFFSDIENAVNGLLNLTLSADDYITAIYANGTQIYGETIAKGTIAPSTWTGTFNKEFSVDLIDGYLDLIFVIHNTNLAGSSTVNPMGLFVNGTFSTDIAMTPVDPSEPPVSGTSTTTPEPATLLILGLGAIGAGVAARRRMTK